MAQEQQQKAAPQKEEEVETVEAADLVNEELNDDIDNLLDEIDDILEVNAEEFVNAFVQKGGQ